jgi:hypothetical protein
VDDSKELAQQAAVMYVSIGNAIDPTDAKDVLKGKRGDVAAVIKFVTSLVAAVRALNVAAVF